MTDLQREHYDGADEIGSDPWHILDRDNRNHRKKQRLILDVTAAEPGDRVLEVGCGHGIHAARYAERYAYTGVDLSPSLVAQTRRRLPIDAHALEADAMALPMDDDSFDAVVGTAVLHHMAAPRQALREWQRVTRPGGSVTLMEPNYLFPKEAISTHTIDAERHKINMRPWRLCTILRHVTDDEQHWRVEPTIYTLPWPRPLFGVYDRVDDALARVPLLRWGAQMLRIHIEVLVPQKMDSVPRTDDRNKDGRD